MTVLAQYAPVKTPPPAFGVPVYFEFESIGQQAIEVWMETATPDPLIFIRERLQPQYYNLFINGVPPTFVGGYIYVQRDYVPASVTRLSIERNTQIAQLADYSAFDPFHMDMIEFSFDRLTMIIQELASKKCSVNVTYPITQPLTFNKQDKFYASMITAGIDKLIAYCQEMVTNGKDCTNDLRNT